MRGDFFNHKLPLSCDPFEEENKLMEISGLDNFPTIPDKPISVFDSDLSLDLSSNSYIKEKVKKNKNLELNDLIENKTLLREMKIISS